MLLVRLPSSISTWLSNLLESAVSYTTSRFTRLLLSILSCGPIPRHIAIVMDGNRRYARERGLRVGRGHEAGFESLKGVSFPQRLCLQLPCQLADVTVCRRSWNNAFDYKFNVSLYMLSVSKISRDHRRRSTTLCNSQRLI
jgi:undecaprenyl pyrophosphate synthase